MNQTTVLFCNCHSPEVVDEATKGRILDALRASGASVTVLDNFCSLAGRNHGELQRAFEAVLDAHAITVLGCFERAVRWLCRFADVQLPENTSFVNFRKQPVEEILDRLGCGSQGLSQNESEHLRSAGGGTVRRPATSHSGMGSDHSGIGSELDTAPSLPEACSDRGRSPSLAERHGRASRTGDWIPWFPVLDYDRCINCKQCLNFCLFGVYRLDEQGVVRVAQPANCKTHCPACARVCPEAAIIFPQYGQAPFNGDEVPDAPRTVPQNVVSLPELVASAGDVHELLRRRSRTAQRFSVDSSPHAADSPSEPPQPTVSDLERLKEQLDIPDEVIGSLCAGPILSVCNCECACSPGTSGSDGPDCACLTGDEPCDCDCDCHDASQP